MLDSWNLIRPVGKQYVGEYENGTPATVYTLTEEGQALLEEEPRNIHGFCYVSSTPSSELSPAWRSTT